MSRFSGFLVAALAFTTFAADRKLLIEADPFCDYVGRWVELKRPVAVVERHSTWGKPRGVQSKVKVDYGLIQTNWAAGMKVFGILPAGHKVLIEDVRDELSVDDEQMMAYGRTTLPWSNTQATFAYSWGAVWVLRPAPWEPDDTPEKRGPPKKLPPHFDYPMFRPPPDAPKWGVRGTTERGAVPPASDASPRNENRPRDIPAVPRIKENKVPNAPRVGNAPRVPDPP